MSTHVPLPRIVAPLALIVVIGALFVIVNSTVGEGGTDTVATEAAEDEAARERAEDADEAEDQGEEEEEEGAGELPDEFYVVREGDSFSQIAERTGIPVATLQDLNPEVDPQALQAGSRLRLREPEESEEPEEPEESG